MPEHEPDSFIKTPLEFFGHSYDEIHFGYPEQYHEELQDAQTVANEEVAGVEERRGRFLAGDPEAQKDRYVSTEQEYELSLSYARRRHTQDVNHKWYEKRFRGRYESNVDLSLFPEVEQFITVLNKRQWEKDPEKHPLPDPLPSADEFAGYFNEALRLNEWSSAHWEALAWYEALPADSPDRETAKYYLAFAGNIVLQEYCRIAVSLACDELADDDFVSVKHLLTVCWPMAMRLEPFIPNEVKRSKQLLRETFLQMAARGSSGFRSHVELFGWAALGHNPNPGFDQRAELEKQAYAALMGFDDSERHDKEAIKQELLTRAEKLAAGQRWETAIDLLELSTHAYGLPLAELQTVIDQYAVDATLYYTSDMSKVHEPWSYMVGRHEIWTNNEQALSLLRLTPGISEETYQKLHEIEDIRELEHTVQRLRDVPEEERATLIDKLFFRLAASPPDLAARFADPEIADEFMARLTDTRIGTKRDQEIDDIIKSTVVLANSGVLTREQQNMALTVIAENILKQAEQPKDYETFSRLIGFMSPILRMTTRTERPADEIIWKFVSREQFASFLDKIIKHAEERTESADNIQWYIHAKDAFLRDIRTGWNAYWDERQEY